MVNVDTRKPALFVEVKHDSWSHLSRVDARLMAQVDVEGVGLRIVVQLQPSVSGLNDDALTVVEDDGEMAGEFPAYEELAAEDGNQSNERNEDAQADGAIICRCENY